MSDKGPQKICEKTFGWLALVALVVLAASATMLMLSVAKLAWNEHASPKPGLLPVTVDAAALASAIDDMMFDVPTQARYVDGVRIERVLQITFPAAGVQWHDGKVLTINGATCRIELLRGPICVTMEGGDE